LVILSIRERRVFYENSLIEPTWLFATTTEAEIEEKRLKLNAVLN
jgi:hypothetical protein